MSQRIQLSWNQAGGLSLAGLCLGALAGIGLMGRRALLAPPAMPASSY
jgi:hypothetical protein